MLENDGNFEIYPVQYSKTGKKNSIALQLFASVCVLLFFSFFFLENNVAFPDYFRTIAFSSL